MIISTHRYLKKERKSNQCLNIRTVASFSTTHAHAHSHLTVWFVILTGVKSTAKICIFFSKGPLFLISTRLLTKSRSFFKKPTKKLHINPEEDEVTPQKPRIPLRPKYQNEKTSCNVLIPNHRYIDHFWLCPES